MRKTSQEASKYGVIANQKATSPIVSQVQATLLQAQHIRLGWIRAHVGHIGNEMAETLAKSAIEDEEVPQYLIPLPRSSAKKLLRDRALAKWKGFWRKHEYGRSTQSQRSATKATTGLASSHNLSLVMALSQNI
ncbi:hypothetical protein AVEN_187365-1 [Araneus ventricosus]|uniref:RNase H type-1 domain-containing protein n=1 Tax=Araneus ventricosus TaxID=182803 RepID=A0A4Y2SCD7_ARAVE|nr:hypothetical protein AVEN_187365-1 [Araneus ventricosus]